MVARTIQGKQRTCDCRTKCMGRVAPLQDCGDTGSKFCAGCGSDDNFKREKSNVQTPKKVKVIRTKDLTQVVKPIEMGDQTTIKNSTGMNTDLPSLASLRVFYDDHQGSSNTKQHFSLFPIQRFGALRDGSSLRQTTMITGEQCRDFAEWCQKGYEKKNMIAIDEQSEWEVELSHVGVTASGPSTRRMSGAE